MCLSKRHTSHTLLATKRYELTQDGIIVNMKKICLIQLEFRVLNAFIFTVDFFVVLLNVSLFCVMNHIHYILTK